jgi:hypothetical protein
MGPRATTEQRAHDRRPLRIQVQLLLPGRPPLVMRTTDISVSGIGLLSNATPPEGLRVMLRIPMPNRRAPTAPPTVFDVQAQVRHSVFSSREDAYRVGLMFVQPSDKLLVAIGNYIAG